MNRTSDTPVVIGLDIGSSAAKAAVMSLESGEILARLREEYPQRADSGAPVNTAVYEGAVTRLLNEGLKRFAVRAVGIASQMYSICAESENGRIIYQWDSDWAEDVNAAREMERLYATTGCPPHVRFPLYKLLSLSEQARRRFLPMDVKAHLIDYLTGEAATDDATASSMGLFDVQARGWNAALIRSLGLNTDLIPRVVTHHKVAGVITNPLIHTNGEQIVVAPGLGDGPSASYACRNLTSLCCNLGTSSAVRTITNDYTARASRSLWRFALDENAYVVGAISSSCCAMIHAAERFLPMDEATEDAGDCLYIPSLLPSGLPRERADIARCFNQTDRAANDRQRAAAVYQAAAFTVCRMCEQLSDGTADYACLAVAGGGVHITALMNGLAHTLPLTIGVLENAAHLAAEGAALSAAEAIGFPIERKMAFNRVIEPDGLLAARYACWKNEAPVAIG